MSTAYSPFEEPDGPTTAPAVELVGPPEASASGVAQRTLTCPECGQQAVVSMNRRLAADFCPRCDYPLFWSPSEVVLDPRGGGESLRRLPGAVGRQSVGSAACPHCAERNQIAATVCIRCGGSMRLAPPPPPPMVAPPPIPVVVEEEPEPESDTFWWWVSAAAGIAMALLLALLLVRWLS